MLTNIHLGVLTMENNLVRFHEIKDERGSLVSIEGTKNIPFSIKRVYYIYKTQDLPRGFHAHKRLKQVLICVSGSCKVSLNNGEEKKVYELNDPSTGLLIESLMWREMYDFSSDCVLMILASEQYDEADYIRDFEEFINEIKQSNDNSRKLYTMHDKSIVESTNIGKDTRIWAYTHIFTDAQIGENCNINDHTLIENDVIIGNNVTVKSGVHIWDGARIGNNVFIGPSVVFTNDLNPRSKVYPDKFEQTIIKDFASIGANATLVAGITVGEYAMIGAGAVVTKDVPPYTLWYGNPAEFKSYLCTCGKKIDQYYYCKACDKDLSKIIMFNTKG